MAPTSSTLVSAGMILIPVLVALALVVGYARAGSTSPARFGAAVFGWLALTGFAGASGVLRHYESRPPLMFVLLLAGLALAVVAARSSIGRRFARGLPLAALIGFSAFRLPLELVMHEAAAEGTMPVQMSFSGFNFDIVSGTSAILVAWLVARGAAPRWLTLVWAVMSSALLFAIMGIALASTPVFAAFGSTPERLNTWIGFFPFTCLPAVLVPAALFGQLVVFRKLAEAREPSVGGRVDRAVSTPRLG